MQISADAFNLLNHQIITGVNGTYSQFLASGTTSGSGASQLKCNATPPAPGATFQGCISPFSGTGLQAFGATSSTNNGLYGPRQMQFAAKLFF
jgi:hypothetical protein